MKLTGAASTGYLRKPDPTHTGALIFGADPMRVATGRKGVVAALVGPKGDDEMRLTRISATDLHKDPALLGDAIKAQGFFPGHRVALVEDATDGLSKIIAGALTDWQPGDAQVVVTAGQLTAKSALRKVFESHPTAVAIGIYDDPPSRDDVARMVANAGLPAPDQEVGDALFALALSLEPGDLRQTVEKLGLYKLGDTSPVSLDDLRACAPLSAEVDVDDVLDVVTEGQADRLGPVLGNLYAQGVTPVTLCIGAMRHFKILHALSSDPGGPGAGAGKLRPPIFGPRRDKLIRAARHWGRPRLEQALEALVDVDLQMRSSGQRPDRALLERTLIRLAMLGRR